MSDPFDLLNLTPRFDLDPDQLQAAFLRESARRHPDRFTDPLEQADAAEAMSQITLAHQTLRDPESRANALLALSGYADREDNKSLPPNLLMEMMEVREDMEQAIDSGDAEKLEKLHRWAKAKREEHLATIASTFASPMDTDSAKKVRLELNTLRYIARMIEQLPPDVI